MIRSLVSVSVFKVTLVSEVSAVTRVCPDTGKATELTPGNYMKYTVFVIYIFTRHPTRTSPKIGAQMIV